MGTVLPCVGDVVRYLPSVPYLDPFFAMRLPVGESRSHDFDTSMHVYSTSSDSTVVAAKREVALRTGFPPPKKGILQNRIAYSFSLVVRLWSHQLIFVLLLLYNFTKSGTVVLRNKIPYDAVPNSRLSNFQTYFLHRAEGPKPTHTLTEFYNLIKSIINK